MCSIVEKEKSKGVREINTQVKHRYLKNLLTYSNEVFVLCFFSPVVTKPDLAVFLQTTTGGSVSAVCVYSEINMFSVHFFVCLHKSAVGHARGKNTPRLCICVWDVVLGYSAVQTAEERV